MSKRQKTPVCQPLRVRAARYRDQHSGAWAHERVELLADPIHHGVGQGSRAHFTPSADLKKETA